MSDRLTPTSALAFATEVLEKAGYSRSSRSKVLADFPDARLFEDPYGVVMLTAWDSWNNVLSGWPAAQGALVNVMSEHIRRGNAKAWDGYLVLLCPGEVPMERTRELAGIRLDTSHVRKLIGFGEEFRYPSDVQRVLAPLLPLESGRTSTATTSILESLPELLGDDELPRGLVLAVLDAFLEGRPLMNAIHDSMEA